MVGPLLHRQFGPVQVLGDFPKPGLGFGAFEDPALDEGPAEAFARKRSDSPRRLPP
jgi:hypothetical protein